MKAMEMGDTRLGGRIHHYNRLLALPAASASVPGLASIHGYDWSPDGNIHEVANLALHGYGVHHMFVRGQQGNSVNNVVPSYGFAAGCCSDTSTKSASVGKNNNPNLYYKNIQLNCK